MTIKALDVGIAKQIGSYSDAVEAGPNLRWLYTSGTPGLTGAGELPRPTLPGLMFWKCLVRRI